MTDTLLHYHNIATSFVDGPGLRAVVWVQGCPIRCPACQNKHLWPETGGRLCAPVHVAHQLLRPGLPVTVTGGEPFAQPDALRDLLRTLKALRPSVHILVYSGFTWEDLLSMAAVIPAIADALLYIDVLVDGPYLPALDHDAMQYRGSSNQRPIDVQATLANWSDAEPVVLDWDTPLVTITAAGRLITAAAYSARFGGLGAAADVRRCGQPGPAPDGALERVWIFRDDDPPTPLYVGEGRLAVL